MNCFIQEGAGRASSERECGSVNEGLKCPCVCINKPAWMLSFFPVSQPAKAASVPQSNYAHVAAGAQFSAWLL